MSEVQAPIELQRRTRICLACRTLFDEGESCSGNKHETVSLREAKGRSRLDDEIWGPDSRARKLRQAAKAGAGGAGFGSLFKGGCDLPVIDGCDGAGEGILIVIAIVVFAFVAIILFYAIRALVRWIRAKMEKPKPHGALLGPPKPKGEVVLGAGVVRSGTPLDVPWEARSAFAYAMELFDKNVFGGGPMLRDAESAGFEVALDDGRTLRVPAGRIRLLGKLPKVELDRTRVGRLLDAIDPQGEGGRALFPFDHARARAIGPGDRVELLGEVERSGEAEGGYRSGAPVVVPVGVPVLRVRSGRNERP